MKPIAYSCLAILLIGVLGCTSPRGIRQLTFGRDVQPILEQRCARCHGEDEQESRLELTSLATIMRGGDSGPAITPGQPGRSLLLEMILDERMPPKPPRPSIAEIDLIYQWIKNGAE